MVNSINEVAEKSHFYLQTKMLIGLHGPEEEHKVKWWDGPKKALVKIYKIFLLTN